jgi:hypothetical protein
MVRTIGEARPGQPCPCRLGAQRTLWDHGQTPFEALHVKQACRERTKNAGSKETTSKYDRVDGWHINRPLAKLCSRSLPNNRRANLRGLDVL